MRRAAKVDGTHGEIVDALRKAGASVLSLAAIGGGAPDILVGFGNEDWTMEIKNPERHGARRRPNTLQQEWHARWRGKPPVVVFTKEDALRVIGVVQ